MSTAIAINPKDPSKFTEIDFARPTPGANDVLVEVRAVSVNPVDTKVHAGAQKKGLEQPRILGWDAAGEVVAVGSNVVGFSKGDSVWYAGDITRPGSNSTHQLVDVRLLSHKPYTLNWAEAAALPLTALTAWEGLFERLQIQNITEEKTLLIIGGAGGVGSLAIPLAAKGSKLKVIATASRPESALWCLDRGAHLTVDYRDMKKQLADAGINSVDYIFCLNDTDGHWDAMTDLIAPFGHICTIVENQHPLNMEKLKLKSASLHMEFMFTRSMFQTADMEQQGKILSEIAKLIDNGELTTTLSETLQGLTVENVTAAHQKLLAGNMRGKLVITF